jgi:hypothetical protein
MPEVSCEEAVTMTRLSTEPTQDGAPVPTARGLQQQQLASTAAAVRGCEVITGQMNGTASREHKEGWRVDKCKQEEIQKGRAG